MRIAVMGSGGVGGYFGGRLAQAGEDVTYDTDAAGSQVRPMVGPRTVVLCLLNGVDNHERLGAILGVEHVLAGVVHILSTISAPGVISQTAGPRTIRFGEKDGGVTALGRLAIGEILACPETAFFYRGVMEEVAAVGRVKGVPLPVDTVDRALAFARGLQPGMRSSLEHDLGQGNRLAVETPAGTVVRYGREVGVPTPFNFAVYACLRPHHEAALRSRSS